MQYNHCRILAEGCCFLVFLLATLEISMEWKGSCSPLWVSVFKTCRDSAAGFTGVLSIKWYFFLCTAPKDSRDLTFYEVEHYVHYPNKTLNSVCWSGRYRVKVRVSLHSPIKQILGVTKILFCCWAQSCDPSIPDPLRFYSVSRWCLSFWIFELLMTSVSAAPLLSTILLLCLCVFL